MISSHILTNVSLAVLTNPIILAKLHLSFRPTNQTRPVIMMFFQSH